MTRMIRMLLVAASLATFAGCAAEDIADPPATAAAVEETTEQTPVAEETPIDGFDAQLGWTARCGGDACPVFTHTCCNNHCVRRVPGGICGPSFPGEGSSE